MIRKLPDLSNIKTAVLGLGYVGLPLAVQIAKIKKDLVTDKSLNRKVIGFDINKIRIDELKNGYDKTKEVTYSDLTSFDNLCFTSNEEDLSIADIFIVTVPTPINSEKKPDLSALENACFTIGKNLKKKETKESKIIIFESTVYPGVTEEICAPILENISGLKFNIDFFCGFSPERINPSDKKHNIENIVKVTSGSTEETSYWIDNFYKSIINAGTFRASSIKVAEAAKVIENTQRDLNIALINELAIIFKKMEIDTLDVLKAAESKWNFLPFKPGLVGGHCIGVDPYYLTYKAEALGHYPKVVLAGREINDEMISWIFDQFIELMNKKNIDINKANVLVLGVSFKENCVDTRNSKVLELLSKFKQNKIKFDVYDPVVNKLDFYKNHNFNLIERLKINKQYTVVMLCVSHSEFCNFKKEHWLNLLDKDGFYMDLKGIIPRELNAYRL